MLKKALIIILAGLALLAAVGAVMYASNSAPAVATLSAKDVSDTAKPYVVKVHAKWCPICMTTKSMWSQLDAAYGTKAKLVVFDVTNDAARQASLAEAKRLGLEKFFNEFGGSTGSIFVLDRATREVKQEVRGDRDFAVYRRAVDAALGK